MFDLKKFRYFGRVKEDMKKSKAWERWALRIPLSLKQTKEDSRGERGKNGRKRPQILLSFLYRSYHQKYKCISILAFKRTGKISESLLIHHLSQAQMSRFILGLKTDIQNDDLMT